MLAMKHGLELGQYFEVGTIKDICSTESERVWGGSAYLSSQHSEGRDSRIGVQGQPQLYGEFKSCWGYFRPCIDIYLCVPPNPPNLRNQKTNPKGDKLGERVFGWAWKGLPACLAEETEFNRPDCWRRVGSSGRTVPERLYSFPGDFSTTP